MKNFYACQPSLNYGYANPDPNHPWEQGVNEPGPRAVRQELKNIIAFWYGKGVDGFRVDMASSLVKNDKDVSITNIDIHGYASPDGPYDNNVRLANNRAAALRNYVCNLYTIDKKLFTYHATPEDWEGFKKKVGSKQLSR